MDLSAVESLFWIAWNVIDLLILLLFLQKNQRNYAILFSDSDDDDNDADKKSNNVKVQQQNTHDPTLLTTETIIIPSTLDIDLSYLERQDERNPPPFAKQNTSTTGGASVTSLLNDLLEDIYPMAKPHNSANNTDVQLLRQQGNQLTKSAIDLIEKLPNLSFMKMNTLMIPVSDVNDKSNLTDNFSLIWFKFFVLICALFIFVFYFQ